MMNGHGLPPNDDWGGRVCRQCNTPDDGYDATLFAYSSYTKRDAARGDKLFLAAQTQYDRVVTVEISRVPYRLFLDPSEFQAIFKEGLYGKVLQKTIGQYAEIRTCIRGVDSLQGASRDVVELRFHSRTLYLDVYHQLKEKNVRVAIDGAHDALHGLDALINLGIPGICVTLRLRRGGFIVQDQSHWRVDRPASVCVHGHVPRFPSNLTEVAIGFGSDQSVCVGHLEEVAWFGATEAMAFTRILSKIRPKVVVVRDKERTLQQIYNYAPRFFSTLFSLSPCCPPTPSTTDRPFTPGLGVLVFDVSTLLGPTVKVHPCHWLDVYRSKKCLEDRWFSAVALQTDMHDSSGSYETFTAAMVLHYASSRTICELSPEAHAPYEGGHVISPRTAYLLEQPVAVFDFVSMYPSIACTMNAGKDTYVAQGGQWNLGNVGGFVTTRSGSLAKVLKERLEERLRILSDPAMQTRAKHLKRTINAMVGMSGHKNNPYSDTRVTGCITAAGRRLLQACHRSVPRITLAGYTDSLFLELPSPGPPSTGDDPLQTWMSRSVVVGYETQFKDVILKEMQEMAPTLSATDYSPLRFECKQITVSGLFTTTAHSYAAGYLTFDTASGNPEIDIQIKGTLKTPVMACARVFYEALVRTSIAGEFLLGEKNDIRLGDIRVLAGAVPTRVMTSSGWKKATRVVTSSGQRGIENACVYFEDGTEGRLWFVPNTSGEGLVDVTHVFCVDDVKACVDRRRMSAIAVTEAFCRQLSQGQLPLDAYAIDRASRVLVKLEDRPSKAVPMWQAARNGLDLDLKAYRHRWIAACIDTLICDACHRPLNNSDQCRYRQDLNGTESTLFHESCSPTDAVSLEGVAPALLSSHIKTALSAMAVAGAVTATEALTRLISLRNLLEGLPIGTVPPSRPYEKVLAELKAATTEGNHSGEYLCPPRAFACIPDGDESWFCLPKKPTSVAVLGLLHEAVRIIARHGRRRDDNSILEAIGAYPAHRLYVAPPPVLMADGQAPAQTWKQVMSELAKSKEWPVLTRCAPVRCQACDTAFNLEMGACGHLACKTCSLKWATCADCGVEWRAFHFDGSPQMNYHASVFPFDEWYEYLPVTGWRVYRGPDELVYDSSARHIIALARGEVHG